MISVIVCTVDPVKAKSIQEHYGKLLAGVPHEMVLIHNARSMASGYNEGIDLSVGDILIFSHDDIEFLQEDFAGILENHMRSVDVLGVAGTDKLVNANWLSAGYGYLFGQVAHPRQSGFGVCRYGTALVLAADCVAIDGCWMCAKRGTAESVRFDDATFTGFHCYDLDFSLKAHLARYMVGVASNLFPIHHSGGTYNDSWQDECKKFNVKHRGVLYVENRRDWTRPAFTSLVADDKTSVLRIMQENLKHELADNQSGAHHYRPAIAQEIS